LAETRVERQLHGEDGRILTGVRLVFVVVLVLLLVAAVGLGSGRPLWDVDGPSGHVSPHSYVGDLVVAGYTTLAVASVWLTIVVRRRRRRQVVEDEPDPVVVRRPVPWWAHLAVVLTLLGTALGALLILALVPRGDTGGTDVVRTPPVPASGKRRATPPDGTLPPVHWWWLALLALVLVAGVAAVWRRRSRSGEPEAEPEAANPLLAAVDLSLEDVESEPDPRRAVIRAYARMEAALGLDGLPRRPFETPLEYLGRALASLRVGRRSVERLTVLHERAKFSRQEVDATMRSEALAALAELRDELAAPG
jgi:hypothetical protein